MANGFNDDMYLLLRNMLLLPPDKTCAVPHLYTAAADLTWGSRIVEAYKGTIALYSIPPDMFHLSRANQLAEELITQTGTRANSNDDLRIQWRSDGSGPSRPPGRPIWPVLIKGTRTGECRGVREIAIFTEFKSQYGRLGRGRRPKPRCLDIGMELVRGRYRGRPCAEAGLYMAKGSQAEGGLRWEGWEDTKALE